MAHTTFPSNLPVPTDDGACSHITGLTVPSINLPTTSNSLLNPSSLKSLTIIFCYPRTGAPNETVPDAWNMIPGARGCTPQACSFRDLSNELSTAGVKEVFGLSTQDTGYQREVHERLHLPFPLLSDENLEFVDALKLPTFEWEGKKVCKRVTLAVEEGKVVKVWYPVFPPDQSAERVLEWLQEKGQKGITHD